MSAPSHDHAGPHVTSMRLLVGVWGSLVFLTWLTVAATYIDLGSFALPVALGIATIKGSLVVLYFMHMRWEKPFNALVFISALLFIAIFVGGALIDTTHYEHNLIPGYAPAVQQP